MLAISDSLHKINPELLWLHIAHSEGGVIALNAYKGMTPEQKNQLNQQLLFLAVGPASPLPVEFGYEARNIYSKQDFVTGGFALKYRNNSKYDVKFVRCSSLWSERTGYIADHAFLGRTYQKEQLKYIKELRNVEGFYDTKRNNLIMLNK